MKSNAEPVFANPTTFIMSDMPVPRKAWSDIKSKTVYARKANLVNKVIGIINSVSDVSCYMKQH